MNIYLYIKTHNKTGLKYLGITTNSDPHSYTGSGIYWKNHLRKHGFDYTTEILKECKSKDEVKTWGVYYSRLWNIVESNEWANLKEEQGDGGRQSAEVRKRIGQAGLGRIPWNKGIAMWSEEEKTLIGERNRDRGPQSLETIEKRMSKNTGKKRSASQRNAMSAAQQGRVITEEHAAKISNATKGRTPWNLGVTGLAPTRFKSWKILNLETNEEVEIVNLRKWCSEKKLNYQVFHRYIKENRPYKNYTAYEIS